MGFGAFIAGAISTVSSFISSVGAYIAPIISKVGPVIKAFAEKLIDLTSVFPEVGTIDRTIGIIGEIVHAVAKLLGIVKEEESPEELGAKVGQAEKNINDFNGDTEKYIEYLRNEIKLDKEKFDKMTPEEKMSCKAVGIALETKAIEEKLVDVVIPPQFLIVLGKIQAAGEIVFNSKQILDIINSLKTSGITDMGIVADYLTCKGNIDRVKTGEALKEAINNLGEVEDVDAFIGDMKKSARNYEE